MTACPDPAVLRRLLEGALEASEESAVLTHLEGCAPCRARLGALPGGSDWAADSSKLRAATTPKVSADSLGAGERLGDYRILREVGRGGMGVVYEAEQVSLGRRVALKVLPAFGLLDSSLVERFRREAHAAARLHHTNIVPVHDAGEERGLHYYAMEFIEGQGLDRVIRELRALAESAKRAKSANSTAGADTSHDSGPGSAASSAPDSSPLPSPGSERLRFYRAIARLGIQAADGLAYAHAHGVLHRDIKPSNLLVDGSSTLWIADFGLARAEGTEPITGTGDVIGTLAYIAPERFRGDSDERGDIYGLGITLYELLTLRPAFQDADRHRLIRRINDEDPPAPRKVDPLIPRDLETIVLKAIQKHPADRYQDASQLAEDLRCFLLDRPIRARRAILIERGWRWCRRNRALAALLLALGLISAAAVLATWSSYEESEARRLAELRHRSDRELVEAKRLHGEGRYEDALARVRTALSLERSQEGRILEANLLVLLERPEESAKLLDALLVEDPDDGAAHYLLATIYRDRDPARSEHHRARAEDLLPDSAEACHLRAVAAPTVTEAVAWLDHGLELDRLHYPSRVTRALTHYALRDFEAMRIDAEVALTLRENDASSSTLLATAKSRLGKPRDALRDLDRALAIDPDLAVAYEQRRALRRLLGDHAGELEDAERFRELAPGDVLGAFHQLAAYIANGRIDEALEAYGATFGSSWGLRNWLRRSVARQVFEDEATGVTFELPVADSGGDQGVDGGVLEDFRFYRGIYRQLRAKARRVARNAYKASWSPDGAGLVYDSVLVDSLRLDTGPLVRADARSSLRIVDVASGKDRLLVEDGKDSCWSPDGRWIAFVRDSRLPGSRGEEVWLVSPEGGEARRLARGGYPTWSNDPSRVFFQSRELAMLCAIDVDAAGAEPTPLGACPYRYPAVSPDGRYFARANDDALEIVEIATGNVVNRWRPPLGGARLLAEWSPDGREVSVGGIAFQDTGLWVFDRASERARLVFPGPAILGAWSPDRKRLAFTLRGYVLETWVAELDPSLSTADALAPSPTPAEYLATLAEEARRAIAREDGVAAHHRRLAQVLEDAGKHAEAAASFRAAYERSTRASSADLEAATRNLERAGERAAAVLLLEESLEEQNRGTGLPRRLGDLRTALQPRFVSYASIDAELERPLVLGPRPARLRYFIGEHEPPADWADASFDDVSWLAGDLPIGYGRPAARTVLEEMRGRAVTLYVRARYAMPAPEVVDDCSLYVVADDGFVAFVNGVEIGRRRAGEAERTVRHDERATTPAPMPIDRHFLPVPRELLRRGPNVVALACLNDAIESPDGFLRVALRIRRRDAATRSVFDQFLALAERTDDPELGRRAEYVRACRRAASGDHAGALATFDALVAAEPTALAPRLRAARSLRELGDLDGARARLRVALGDRGGVPFRAAPWDLWWTLTAVDSERDLNGIAQALAADADVSAGFGRDLRETLAALAERGVVRINCGGETYTSAAGVTWLADRFFTCGFPFASENDSYGAPRPSRREISGTDDDPLFRTERWFSPDFHAHLAADGYRIPLPPGDYRVTMQFCEIYYGGPRQRVFEVHAEGSPEVAALDIFAERGFAHPVTRSFERSVRDGFLDLELVRSLGEPQVSALEIERIR